MSIRKRSVYFASNKMQLKMYVSLWSNYRKRASLRSNFSRHLIYLPLVDRSISTDSVHNCERQEQTTCGTCGQIELIISVPLASDLLFDFILGSNLGMRCFLSKYWKFCGVLGWCNNLVYHVNFEPFDVRKWYSTSAILG